LGRGQQEAVSLLAESGNKEFKKGNIKVHCFFYQPNQVKEDHIRIKSDHPCIKSHLIQCPTYERFLEIVTEWQEEDNARQHKAIAEESKSSGDWYIRNALGQG
jgi:hypothetical protein